jgi:translation initiation factor IF-1
MVKSRYKKQLIIGWSLALLFCIGGAVLIVLGWARYVDSRNFAAGATSARGEVVGFEKYDAPASTSVRDDIYYAVVRYETETGEEIRFRGPSKDGPVRLKTGDKVDVLYYPDDPQKARVDSFMGLWFPATILTGLGAAAILLPLLTMWQAWKWVKQQDQ